MAIDAEDVLVCIWRFIRFFINTSYTCVQKHPFFSGFLLLFFLVYMFFNLLVYHSPFLICIAILLRFFWSSERPATENVKEKEKETEKEREKTNQITPLTHSIKEDYVVVNRDSQSFSSIRRQRSRRTIHKRNQEWKGQPAKEENDMSFSLTIDQNPKLVVKERASFSFEHRENSTANNIQVGSETSKPETPLASDDSGQKLKKSDSYGVVSEAEIIEESEDEEEEEEAIDNGNKAVEWTEDDQKNLMDLGLSEIERNRRLESLIAKRRARNLFKVQVEKGLVDLNSVVPCPIAPVFVSRNNPFEVPNGTNEIESLQVPGSAPSILLPNKNPFDLPYDPLEEKPNLMADSFQQEFSAVNQKEMLFCRHESFSLGPLQFDHDQHERRDSKSNAFFGSEKRGLEGFGNPRFKRQSGDHDTLMDQFLSDVGVGKSQTDHTLENGPKDYSEASKMDLEAPVNEDSTDESASSSSIEMANRTEVSRNLEPNQENVGHNMFTSSIPTIVEPLYDSSPTANDKNRMEDSLFFADHKVTHVHTPTFSIASDMQVEVSESGSPPLTVGNMSPNVGDSLSDDIEVARSNSTNFDGKSYDDISQVMEEVEKLRDGTTSDTLAYGYQETTIKLTEQLATHPFFEVLPEGTEKSWNPPDESVKENVAYDESDSVTDIIDDMEDQDKEEEKDEDDDGPQMLTRQAIEESLQKPAKKRDLESNLHIERNSENLVEHQAMDSAQPLKGNPDFNVTEDNEKQIEQEGITYTSKPIEAEDNLNKTEDRKNELSSVQSEVSYVIYSSSSPSSPTSTQIEPMKIEEVSSSDLNQEIDIDVPQSNLEDLVKSSSLDEQPLDDTSLIMPQNVKHLVDDSSSHLSNTGDFNILEEPSASEKFSDGTNIISNTNELVVIDDKVAKEELETQFNPAVEIGSGSNEDIENVTGKLAEEPTNLHSKATEDATYIPSDPSGCEKDTVEMDNFKSTEESKDENEDLRHLSGSADTAKDYLQATNCVGTESNDLMEQDLVDQSSKASRDHISISTSTTVEG